MNLAETAQVLATISQYNGMTVDKARTLAWHDLIQELDYEETIEVVKEHFRTSTEWVQPAHLLTGTKIRRKAEAEKERAARQFEARAAQVPRQIEPKFNGLTRAELAAAARAAEDERAARNPEFAAALALKRAKVPPSKSSAFDARWKVKFQGGRAGGEDAPRGRDPERLGGLLRVVRERMDPGENVA